MKRQCPICLREDKLVEHHWYEDDTHMVGHIRLICHCCNLALQTMDGDNNHVLPEWDKQVEYLHGSSHRIIRLIKMGDCYGVIIPAYWIRINKVDLFNYSINIIIDDNSITITPSTIPAQSSATML